MCGIAGIVDCRGDEIAPVILKKMTDSLEHRGPDSDGQWIEGNIGLGHRRLAIIDLTPGGHQPMISQNHRYILSYNGEVYNYRALRTELEADGIWFRSNTDTEVVLNAYAKWGTKAFSKFNGMFALSIWDRKDRTLTIARDRYGIKPLYYSRQGKYFYFASEQKAIIANPNFQKKLNKPGLIEYFTFQNIFTNNTLQEDIKLLKAGHYATLKDTNSSPIFSESKYWDYCFREPQVKVNNHEYVEELNRLFKQAVNRQLVSDVEVGAYLSGGMDSGSITAIASQQLSNLKSFTVGFDLSSASGLELSFDERQKAEAMSALFKTEHYEMILKAGDMERSLPQLAWHLEEPRVGQSYPNYYAALLASKFVKVVMSGSGGDELFGGYPWRYYRTANAQCFEDYIDQYYLYWQRLVSNSELRSIFSPIWSEVEHVWTRDIFKDVFLNHDNQLERPEDYINHSLYFEAKTFLHGLFIVEDKISMAHGLESRVPFMDNDLVDFAMQCPVELKLNNLQEVLKVNENDNANKKESYFQKTNDGKQILRSMMSEFIPDEITNSTKQGFSSPDASWFKGESIDFVKRRLLNPRAKIYDFLNYESTRTLVGEHLDGEKNRRLMIWSLLNLEEYLNIF